MENLEYEENREYEENQENSEIDETEASGFLANLETDNYIEPLTEKEQNKQMKAYEKQQKMIEKSEKKREADGEKLRKQAIRMEKEFSKKEKDVPKEALEEDCGLFSENATKILGKDRLILLKKINQYKSLFPQQLGKFKIKKNPSVEDLTIALQECSSLVEVNTADEFMLTSIMESLKMVESYSAETVYDIRGMSVALSSTPQFTTLMKILFIKYSIFSNVPVEYQLMMVIFSTAYLVMQKNRGKNQLNSYLDEPFRQ